jgi:hypothetical protein
MTMLTKIQQTTALHFLLDRIRTYDSWNSLPREQYMVYALAINSQCVVCGHGQRNRARIVFDNADTATEGHLKSMVVRVCYRYSEALNIERLFIECANKEEAKEIERLLQTHLGGNANTIPNDLRQRMIKDLQEVPKMVLEMASHSAFSGLRDLKKWRKEGILNDDVWQVVEDRLGTW